MSFSTFSLSSLAVPWRKLSFDSIGLDSFFFRSSFSQNAIARNELNTNYENSKCTFSLDENCETLSFSLLGGLHVMASEVFWLDMKGRRGTTIVCHHFAIDWNCVALNPLLFPASSYVHVNFSLDWKHLHSRINSVVYSGEKNSVCGENSARRIRPSCLQHTQCIRLAGREQCSTRGERATSIFPAALDSKRE